MHSMFSQTLRLTVCVRVPGHPRVPVLRTPTPDSNLNFLLSVLDLRV